MNDFFNKLLNKQSLTSKESEEMAGMMLQSKITNTQIAAILVALRCKGESVSEILGFVKEIKRNALHVDYADAIDVCGTGGDRKSTFNISTAVAFVVAAGGVAVAKHGNRAVSSNCGSADVLEKLGVNIMLTPSQAQNVLEKVGTVFLFAPLFHTAFKHVAPIRKELGFLTIFNYLGPFLNPTAVNKQIIGTPTKELAEKLIQVAAGLYYDHVFVVSGEEGLDEVSLSGKTHIFELKDKKISSYLFDPSKYGFQIVPLNQLLGKSPKENAAIIKDILNNKKSPKRDVVVLNSAFALYVSGKVKSVQEGIGLADRLISSGRARKILENLRRETQKYV